MLATLVSNQHKLLFWRTLGTKAGRFVADDPDVRFAVRFDARLERKLRRLPLNVAVAEANRQLGREAGRLGIYRPSYACVRLHVARERIRRARRNAALEVAALLAFTRAVVPTLEGIEREYARAVDRRLGWPRRPMPAHPRPP